MKEFDKKNDIASSNNNPYANNGGQNIHIPTPENIRTAKNLVKCGVQTRLVAATIGIDEKTLFKHYKKHMDIARANAHGAVGQSIFKRAMDGDATAMKLYAKAQMGWRDEVQPEAPPAVEVLNNQDADDFVEKFKNDF